MKNVSSMQVKVKRGDIFYANLNSGDNHCGSEQFGLRPVLVVQNDIGNRYAPTIIVVCISTKHGKLPTHVHLKKGVGNLNRDSIVLCEQLRTIDKIRLLSKIGHLDKDDMDKIDKAIIISLSL